MNTIRSLEATLLIFAGALLLTAPAIKAADTKSLLDVAAANADQQLIPKNAQTSVKASPDAATPGIVVSIEPGTEPYPGVVLKPQSDEVWNLSAFGHIEARLTNTGAAPLTVALQVDNAGDWHDSPWNAEQISLKPGATGSVSVIFGYSYGHKRGYALEPAKISRLLLFAIKSNVAQSFRIDSLTAAGPAGEKPFVDPNSIRTRPKDGIVFGPGVTVDAAKQIAVKGGAKASVGDSTSDSSLKMEFPAGKGESSVLLKPTAGAWDLGEATQVRVKVKNTGDTPITPAIQLVSGKIYDTDFIPAAAPLAPGAEQEIVIPFAPAKRWEGMPSAGIWKGALSGEKTGSPESKPGTGTLYSSDRTDGIRFTVEPQGQATLQVESIRAEAPTFQPPEGFGTRPPVAGEWVQTFDEEFNAKTLDLKKWNNEGPNYWDKISHWSKDNVVLDGQMARLHYEKKTGFQNDNPTQKQTNFTGGYLDTFGKWRQRYGYFEARMKLPTAPGLWPAFWMMPDRGAATPDAPGSKKNRCTTSKGAMEFDIMEHLTVWGPHRYNIAMHWDDYGPTHKSIGTGKVYCQADKDGFITTGLLWLPGLAVYYCNGQEVVRWEDPRVSDVPSFMILYMPTGGWDNNILDAAKLPDDLVIDYVRCWQRADLATAENDPANDTQPAPATQPDKPVK